MSTLPSAEDSLLQDRLAQLNVIVNRRNEFLRGLFRLLRTREDINTIIDNEDEELDLFLKRFDIEKGPEHGSIFNLRDDEISFPMEPLSSSKDSTDIENAHTQAASTRTTRSRAKAEEVSHSSPSEKSKNTSEKATGSHLSHNPPLHDNNSENMAVDTDEDQDELDIIGPYTDEAKIDVRSEINKVSRLAGLPGTKTEVSISIDKRPLPEPSTDATPHIDLTISDAAKTRPPGELDDMKVEEQKDLPKDQESAREKIDVEVEVRVAEVVEVNKEAPTISATVSTISDNVPSQKTQSSPLLLPSPSTQAAPPHVQQATLQPVGISGLVTEKTEPTASVDSYRFIPAYTIPPLSVLPADFTKKAKSIKRKKDKEKEREGKRDKDDNVPMGLSRWAATLMANPLWRKVSRANKTLSTHDWSVAMTELRLIRTIERIELLKNEGRWSFRQPKKQRGIGGSVKSHWDYLLDEMKWMRTDFREERRWKLALAYNLSTAVLEWHYARTPEERRNAGIVVKWKRLRNFVEDDTTDSTMDMSLDDVDRALKPGQLLGLDYGSEEEEEEEDGNQVMDPLELSVAIHDALDSVGEIQAKDEEMEEQTVLQFIPISEDVAIQPDTENRPDEHAKVALKPTSENPLLSGSKSSSQSVNGDGEPTPVSSKPSESAPSPLRQQIAHSNDLFFDLSNTSTLMVQPDSQNFQLHDLDLRALFPDLQPFGLLDVSSNPVITNGETRKKSERRSERDDPTKRVEDLNFSRLFATGRFMHTKPTLIGPLQPAKRYKDGVWLPIDPQAVTADADANNRVPEELSNDLFEGRSSIIVMPFHTSLKDKDARRKGNEQLWTASDDMILKQLVDRYSANWALVAECYNSSRFATPTERRTPADCSERWKERWSAERKSQLSEQTLPAGEENGVAGMASQSPMTTRAVKRLASNSVSNGQGLNVAGEKKRRRHYLLQESIKRAVKKRADAIKTIANSKKSSSIHETHQQYDRINPLTPSELARMKAERDQRESQDIQMARRRQEEAVRQNLLREQAQRAGVPHGTPVPQLAQNQQPPQPQPQTTQSPQTQAQTGQTQQAQQQQPLQQQLAQLQQLQAQQQQQSNQTAGRTIVSPVVLPNRQTRLATATPANGRPINPQAQAQAQAHLMQQVRAMQLPLQLPPAAQANLAQVLQAQANNSSGQLSGNPYYSLPSNLGNLTQEQILSAFALQSGQHAQQPAT